MCLPFRYSSERYKKNLVMMTAVDGINSIFSRSCLGNEMIDAKLRHMRSAGMLGVNALGELKGFIAKFAMGRK